MYLMQSELSAARRLLSPKTGAVSLSWVIGAIYRERFPKDDPSRDRPSRHVDLGAGVLKPG